VTQNKNLDILVLLYTLLAIFLSISAYLKHLWLVQIGLELFKLNSITLFELVKIGLDLSKCVKNDPKLSKIVPNGPKRSQMVQMVSNGPKWSQNGPKWSQMVPNGPKWSQMVPNGPKWSQMVSNDPKWLKKG
jgi:hypothetical protein